MKENWPKPNSDSGNEPKKEGDLENIPKAEGVYKDWRTNKGLTFDLGFHEQTIKKIADQYLETNPEYFKELKGNGGIYIYYSPELIKIIRKEINKIPKAEGMYKDWRTNNLLAEELSLSELTVKKIADQYLETNPEYFKELRIESGPKRSHYSPELIEIIKKKVEEFKVIPKAEGIYKDWRTNNGLINELGATYETIKKIADKYIKSNPEYFKELRIESGPKRSHYSPELIKIIRKEINKIPKAEGMYKDWRTNNLLAEEFSLSEPTVKKIADQYLETNPEYFKELRSKGGITIYYSPELIEIIRKEINKIPKAEGGYKGWVTSNFLAQDLGVGQSTVKKISDQYVKSNPEYFKELKPTRGPFTVHYSPELIEIIKNNIRGFEKAPRDWKPKENLEQKLRDMGLSEDEIRNIIEKNRYKFPDDTGRFKSEQ